MYIRDLFLSLRRRWYLLPVVLMATVACAMVSADRVGPTYRSSATVVLVPPETTLGETGNPYLFLGGLQQSVDVLSRTVGSEYVRKTVARSVPEGSYEVRTDVTTSAPMLVATTEASSPEAADRLLTVVLAEVPQVLDTLQRSLSVPRKSQIQTQVIARTAQPETVQRGQYSAVVVVGGVSLVLGLLLVSLVDGLLLRWTRTRGHQRVPARSGVRSASGGG